MKIGIGSYDNFIIKENQIALSLNPLSNRCPILFEEDLKKEMDLYEVLFNKELTERLNDETKLFSKCINCDLHDNDICKNIRKTFTELVKEYFDK